jgi:hypothetical protein
MSASLQLKLFNQFKEMTDAASLAISGHLYPMLEGGRAFEIDAVLSDLYEEWQACCRAAAAALQRTLYPNEYASMPKMPNDDEEHQPCRQMAAVLIERTIYGELTAQRWFHAAAENIKNHPSCANHASTCICKVALEGWTNADNMETVKQLQSFYKAHYQQEKDEDYLQAVRSVAKLRGRTFEQQMEHERLEQIKALAEADDDERDTWAFICYQDVDEGVQKHTNGKTMHGYYKVTKTADCYEFMLKETNMKHPDWQKLIDEKHVERIPLDMPMGVKDTAFEDVTPNKIHAA